MEGRGNESRLVKYERGYSEGKICFSELSKVMENFLELVWIFEWGTLNEQDGLFTTNVLRGLLEARDYR